jgi:hypothetical protein
VLSAPVTVAPGGTFDASWQIQNTGTAGGTASYCVLLSGDAAVTLGDTVVFSGATLSTAPSAADAATVTCTVPAFMPEGQYYDGLYVDSSTTSCTTNRDVTVDSPDPPPPDRDGGSCAAIPGRAAPAGGFGGLVLALAALGTWRLAKRRACA